MPDDISTSPDPGANALVLVRYSGDLTTKGRLTRQYFSKRLARNIKDALRSLALRSRIERRHDRLHVQLESEADAQRAVPRIAQVFGVQSVAPVTERQWRTREDLVRHGVELFGDAVTGKRFAVRARRVGDRSRIPMSSAAHPRARRPAHLTAPALPQAGRAPAAEVDGGKRGC